MIGHIYITGQIGSIDDEKGVELQDVIVQVESNKMADELHFHVKGPGGSVPVGDAISEYISTLDNAFTIAEGVASISTRICLSVPVENRSMLAETDYFIHNPLFAGVTGNAEELREAANKLEPIQKELLSMYNKSTGLDKPALEGLMKAETSLTDEQCKVLGFVSEILPKKELKAVAFYDDKNKNKNNTITMEAISKKINDKFDELMVSLNLKKKEEAVAAMVVTDKGELTYESEGDLPVVGDVVTIDGEPTGEGDYVAENGWVISVDADSIVTAVAEPVAEEETVEALKAKIEEMETKAIADSEAREKEYEEAMDAKILELKTQIGSNYDPKAKAPDFGKNRGKAPALSMKDKAKARNEELEERKKK